MLCFELLYFLHSARDIPLQLVREQGLAFFLNFVSLLYFSGVVKQAECIPCGYILCKGTYLCGCQVKEQAPYVRNNLEINKEHSQLMSGWWGKLALQGSSNTQRSVWVSFKFAQVSNKTQNLWDAKVPQRYFWKHLFLDEGWNAARYQIEIEKIFRNTSVVWYL